MTRAGRVEVYRSLVQRPLRPEDTVHTSYELRWRYRAPNGVKIGRSEQGYRDARDLVHNLEQNFPGYKLLDQDGGLTGPDWFMHGMEFAHPNCAAEIAIPDDQVMGVGMRGVRIPVAVPPGANLRSRR